MTSVGLSVGRGVSDITGEAADCGMLGYGKIEQRTAGIHLRLRSRAFVFDDGEQRVLLVVAELPLPMQNVTDEVLRLLAMSYGDTYTARNTLITTTHTHAGPGGYCGHLLYNLSTSGFRPATFTAIVDGIVESIRHAHEDLAPAEVRLSHGELRDASINRSPSSFDRNPATDRDFFPGRVDPLTTLIQIDRGPDTVGALHFFATHGTSMTNRNLLITGDNKGFAAYHWERTVRGADYLTGQPDFVGAFAQTNAGDMSPHVDGPIAYGPSRSADEMANTRQIGLAQFEDAVAQLGNGTLIGTDVDSRLTYLDLANVVVGGQYTPDGREHRTGPPMIAAAMFAGTDEGEGFRGFRQGRNALWDNVSRGIYRVGAGLRAAQEPKGMVMPAHLLNRLQPFIQEIVPVQLVRIGRLYLIGIPGEPTITSGLRLRRTVSSIVDADLNDVLCVGYSNAYIHYVTTPEEYLEQRYEGGSTLFGRWELPALMQTVAALAEAMRDGCAVSPGPGPRRTKPRSWLRMPPADVGSFGAIVAQPEGTYGPGETVEATFVSAYPNNDLHRNRTFLEVMHLADEQWVRVADDGDWSTTFEWRREGRASSHVRIRWDIPADAAAGRYRIVHHGTTRDRHGRLEPFVATTGEFTVR
ncbi:neutral ceramidase [Mycobacterium vicinigordonae]|uniref:Neutral ceramidase n=1 Tax=Mycobacterium vicinigordonae TaxID=1719132 RepID=A0A7D6HVB9_9MYCO|nr:neutral ceramidase [Mycobacterium vicinigordonae]QLL08312.1 neutral/alkaline ceramidase [Mycobacterium vicinigordonae]